MDQLAFQNALADIGLTLDPGQLEKFCGFEDQLYLANQVMNLTRVPQEEAWLRHFVDSLLFHDLIALGSNVLDIGSGPGFPAWPLACARLDLQVTALDSSGKMLGFLRTQPLSNLQIVETRAEEWGIRDQFDVVTGRAVAPLSLQLELSASYAKVGGTVLPMRTPTEQPDVEAFPAYRLGLELVGIQVRELPGTGIMRLFASFRKVKETAKTYPRTWSEMKKKPLT